MTRQDERKKAYRYGMAAEKIAGAYLRCKGYRILAERYRNAYGEIDLVAMKGRTLVAVEVKARKSLEQCEETITPWKQQKIARAVEGLLAGHSNSSGKIAGLAARLARNMGQTDIRFDVVWIAPWQWPRHIRDAWRM